MSFGVRMAERMCAAAPEPDFLDCHSARTEIRWIPPAEAEEVFAAFAGPIRRALSRAGGNLTLESLLEAVQIGGATLWAVEMRIGSAAEMVAAAVVEVIERPARTAVSVILVAGGGMEKWIGEATEALDRYRIMNGADSAEAVCRPGMARALERLGWRRAGIVMESGPEARSANRSDGGT